ncbi:MAG TPA: hypothetical protein VMB51_05300 [Solirubrobacteraceae bacterium]|nr:hypothetical protein [Solirubrobacteraceae bacterium]
MTDLSLAPDPSRTPGAWERELVRRVPGGRVTYREAPAGWLTKDGNVRQKPYREYVYEPDDGRAVKLTSVTTLLDAICPKPGIPYYAEERGIEGALLAFKAGMLAETSRAEHAIAVVREQGLGADAATKRAQRRGLNLHSINQAYMETGEVPKLAEHPAEHHGYIQAWAKMIRALDPEPVEVEQLVVHGEDGYAGRLDMRAIIGGLLDTLDLKTQERGGIYAGAHWQVNLYERAAVWCGAEPASHRRVIVLPASGDWNLDQHCMMADHEEWRLDAALAWWRASKPVENACASRNRAVRG